MSIPESFSQRRGYEQPQQITLREALPSKLRAPIMKMAARRIGSKSLWQVVEHVRDPYGIEPHELELPGGVAGLFATDFNLKLICRLVDGLHWHQVYDFAEAVYADLAARDAKTGIPIEGAPHAPSFERELNEYFLSVGIGWKLVGGEIVSRGDEGFAANSQDGRRSTSEGSQDNGGGANP
jgi:AbiJ N-terminal domain 4